MALSMAEDRNAIRALVKGNVEYDYASGIRGKDPVYDEHPYAAINRQSIARARSHKLTWNPRTNPRITR